MNEYVFTGFIGLISTGLGYLIGQRKNKAEATKIEIENVKEVIDKVYLFYIVGKRKQSCIIYEGSSLNAIMWI